MSDTKIFYHTRWYRYEYHGKKEMSHTEAEEGIRWFKSKFSKNFRGKVVAKIRKFREPNGKYSLWHRDSSHKE